MKKFFSVFMSATLVIMLLTQSAFAVPPGFSGGVNNEYEYEEVVFITGKPIKFVGEIDISESEKDGSGKLSYKFKLEPKDRSIDAKLSRSISIETEYTKRDDKGQTIGDAVIGSYSEKIEVGNDKYELEDFQFSKSDVIDNRAASDFLSGNFKGRKYYKVNKTEGTVIVDISGGDVGYENFWGETGTNIIDYTIDYKRTIPAEDDGEDPEDVDWSGTVRAMVSDSTSKTLKYSENEAGFSSFNGGHMRVTKREVTSRYTYSLPDMDDEGTGIDQGDGEKTVPGGGSDRGTIEISREMSPKIERLIVPKFRDLSGHWAQADIEKLYSLDVLEESGDFFSPDVPMTRMEFIKGVMKACNIRPEMEDNKKRSSRSRKQPAEESVFTDISVKDEDYAYIRDAYKKGIIRGEQSGMFYPDSPLTRAQAVTILIRALGFENKAPTPGYYSGFSDDRQIQSWGKSSVYMAKEIGLVQGDEQGRFNPNEVMTRSQASVMVVRFLEFLQRDLQRDYRENIVYFN